MTSPGEIPTELIMELASEAVTEALGQRLAAQLRPGDVIALIGPLGAGKTRLVKAICAALDVPEELVNSPTFTLIQEYAGRFPIRHCDVYRLKSAAEFPDLGLEDLFADDGLAIIEWADRVAGDLPIERLEIRLEPTGMTSRRANLKAFGSRRWAFESL